MTMTPGPNTVDDLINWFKKSVEPDYNFTLQYEDPEFNNALCNLTDISDLPEKPTIRIIPVLDLIPVPQSEISSEVSSQADTEILSTSSLEGRKEWPEVFDIPKFPVDVEYRLRQGNLLHLRDGTYLKVTKDMKHDILEKLAETIYGYKAYPTKEEFEVVAKALVAEHPCLKEQGSSSGCQGWINSLKFKMGNYRTKMRQLGRPDVTVNGGKCGKNNGDGEPSRKNIKKPRKGEINYLPEFPEGMDVARLEAVREAMVNEMQKKNPNDSLIRKNMDITFALRREEVVKHEPDISLMVQRWPALFTESQVYLEFNRVVGRNLKEEFFGVLDGLCPSLMEIFKRKTGRIGKQLADLVQQTTSTEPTAIRCLILRGLPVILGDDASMFFKSSSNLNEGDSVDIPVGILCYEDTSAASPASPQLNPSRVGIILEGSLVMEALTNLPQAMCLLFGFTYALHLQYPKCLKNTFAFIQQVMLNLGRSELPPKVQKLKNDLAV
ncbi:hypothetical protein D5F01_LYC08899 [Larimichthys crocea]|uniref:Sterile alpha motif domain-containing protein 3 n=1 Tax=Larimichthys crocea TaxID=215358 RepID=A0A6G0IJ54_LARCR|nr:hypothetical protein D5F01_LYC08899 [Larimichthys crocea]